jgi:hypothetical protein
MKRLPYIAACFSVVLVACLAQAGIVVPWSVAPPADSWIAPLPDGSEGLEAEHRPAIPLSGSPTASQAPWPGFAYGLSSPGAFPQFHHGVEPSSSNGAWDDWPVALPAVLGLDDPSRWPAMTLSDGAASAEPYASEIADAGTAAEQEESDDIFAVIPEPATLSLLGLGGALALLRRRRGR